MNLTIDDQPVELRELPGGGFRGIHVAEGGERLLVHVDVIRTTPAVTTPAKARLARA